MVPVFCLNLSCCAWINFLSGPGLLMTLKYFDWHHVTVIASEATSDLQYDELGKMVIQALNDDDTFYVVRSTSQVKSPPDDSTIRSIFTVTKKEARSKFPSLNSFILWVPHCRMAFPLKFVHGFFGDFTWISSLFKDFLSSMGLSCWERCWIALLWEALYKCLY